MSTWRISLAFLLAFLFLTGCAGVTAPSPATVTVSLSPASPSIRAGDSQQFTAVVTGDSNTAVTWSVNGVVGGNPTVGTMTPTGLFTAPDTLSTPNTISIQATSQADATAKGTSSATLLNPVPVITAVAPSQVGLGAFTIVVTGSKFVNGAQVLFGGSPLPTTFGQSTSLSASGNASVAGNVTITVQNPDPGTVVSVTSKTVTVSPGPQISAAAATRFLEQSTFGPTSQAIEHVQQIGFANSLQEQFDAPSSLFDDAVADAQGKYTNADTLQRRWFTNALNGPDQLRQRVAFALHKLWVVSWVDVNDSRAFVSYLRMHQAHAFGNYRQIMETVTKNPAMGRYQDIANNDGAANRAGNCNENYGRELMQLFTIGLWKLNPDGTFQFDAQNNPIPAYDPITVVAENACALTGWTYAKETPATRDWPRPVFYGGTLEAVESHHDKNGGTLIDGFVLPPGGTAQRDLTLTLDNVFCHPNLPPFVAKLLIQNLVTSNPSPAYVQRAASVWTGGTCTPGGTLPTHRGDMKTLITAILLDPEARRGDTLALTDSQIANDGKLREPILLMTNLLRALGAQSDGNLANAGRVMGQYLLFPPTVFSYFSPEYRIPSSPLLAPEMAIQNTATTFERINFINTTSFGARAGTTIDWTPLTNWAANGTLLDNLNALLLHGTMSSSMRSSISTALNAVPAGATQNQQRARTAFYLITSSSQYQVQH